MSTAWDPSNWNGQMTIDPDGLTITAVSGFSVCGLALDKLTGKTFFCLNIISNGGATDGQVGLGIASRSVDRGNFLGNSNLSMGAWPGDSAVWINNSRVTAMDYSVTDGITLGVAVDPVAKLLWGTIDGVTWNAGGTANPTTGVGGSSFGAISGDIYPAVSLTITGAKGKGLFAKSTWPAGWQPAGFNEINAPVPIGATSTTQPFLGQTSTGKIPLNGSAATSLVVDAPAVSSLPIKGSSTSSVAVSQFANASGSPTLSGNANQTLTFNEDINGNLLIQGKVVWNKLAPVVSGTVSQNCISTVHNNYNASADQTLVMGESVQGNLRVAATSDTSLWVDQVCTSRRLIQASAYSALSVSQLTSGHLGERPARAYQTLRLDQSLSATIVDINPWNYGSSTSNVWNID